MRTANFGFIAFFFSVLLVAAQEISEEQLDSNDISKIRVYWNIPTFQCDSHKLNFSQLAEKYHIIQNNNDRFRGEDIAILYDPGNFPAILKDGAKTFLRNGGVPQEGNLTLHLQILEELLEELIPDYEFSGVGILDFESWRPVFRQNFGALSPYKELSISVEKKRHPLWPKHWLENEAKNRFEYHGRQFVEQTLLVAKYLRPNASWGYYAYPYCFNMSPNNMRKDCPQDVTTENNQIDWLFEASDNLYPSLYLGNLRLTAQDKVQMIEGRIDEAHRIAKKVHKTDIPKILPYFWYKYHDTKEFVTKDDLFNTFTVLSASTIDGLILWGSSNDVNTKSKCLQLHQYIDDILGPLLINNF